MKINFKWTFAVAVVMVVVSAAGVFTATSCSKENANESTTLSDNVRQSKSKGLSLTATITTDSTVDRLELLDIGNIYESKWDRRYFQNGSFVYNMECTKNTFNSEFAVIQCGKDSVSIVTDEGDTVNFYNIVSNGNVITYDMRRDDNSVAHFSFTSNQEADFVHEMKLLMGTSGAKAASVWIKVATKIIPGPVGTIIAVAALSYEIYRTVCDRYIHNGEEYCHSYGCGAWEGRCCVRCTGGKIYPSCTHIGDVYGSGSSCN